MVSSCVETCSLVNGSLILPNSPVPSTDDVARNRLNKVFRHLLNLDIDFAIDPIAPIHVFTKALHSFGNFLAASDPVWPAAGLKLAVQAPDPITVKRNDRTERSRISY